MEPTGFILLKMEISMYDNPEEKGIDLEFDLMEGMAIRIFLTDEGAKDMIDKMQNKLNARGHF